MRFPGIITKNCRVQAEANPWLGFLRRNHSTSVHILMFGHRTKHPLGPTWLFLCAVQDSADHNKACFPSWWWSLTNHYWTEREEKGWLTLLSIAPICQFDIIARQWKCKSARCSQKLLVSFSEAYDDQRCIRKKWRTWALESPHNHPMVDIFEMKYLSHSRSMKV